MILSSFLHNLRILSSLIDCSSAILADDGFGNRRILQSQGAIHLHVQVLPVQPPKIYSSIDLREAAQIESHAASEDRPESLVGIRHDYRGNFLGKHVHRRVKPDCSVSSGVPIGSVGDSDFSTVVIKHRCAILEPKRRGVRIFDRDVGDQGSVDREDAVRSVE